MKTILLVFGGIHNPTHVLEFAITAAKQNQYNIHGIFLDDEPPAIEGDYLFPNDLSLAEEGVTPEAVNEQNEKIVAEIIRYFEDECALAGITCSVEKKVSFKGLIKHSSNASFLAIDAKANFEKFALPDILTDVHCPVCIVAATAPKIEHLIFAFDGSKASQYAIKKFIEFFPSVDTTKIYLISVNSDSEVVTHKEFINDCVVKHFPTLTIKLLEGNLKETFINFLRQYPDNALVVMGAYSRSSLSRMFHSSLANTVLSDTRLSLFIAHE